MSATIETTNIIKSTEGSVPGAASSTTEMTSDHQWSDDQTEEFLKVFPSGNDDSSILVTQYLPPSLLDSNPWYQIKNKRPNSLRVKNSSGNNVDIPFGETNVLRDRSTISDDESLVRAWIDREHDIELHDAMVNLFDRLIISLKKSKYTSVWCSTEIIDYLSISSRGHFRTVVEHSDDRSGDDLRLWDWNCGGNHFYIFTSSKTPNWNYNWTSDEREKLSSIQKKNLVDNEETGEKVISKKGYSILRRHAVKALCMQFMKLRFFKRFDEAKKFTINSNTSGDFINFLKKTPYVRNDFLPKFEEEEDV